MQWGKGLSGLHSSHAINQTKFKPWNAFSLAQVGNPIKVCCTSGNRTRVFPTPFSNMKYLCLFWSEQGNSVDSRVQYIYFQYLLLFCEAGSRERHKRPLILRPTFIRWHFIPYGPWWHSIRLSRAVTGSFLGVSGTKEAVREARVDREFCWSITSAGANSTQKTLQWVTCAGLFLKTKEPLRVKKLSVPRQM